LMTNTTPADPKARPKVPTSRRTGPEKGPVIWLYECTRKESSISTKGIARGSRPHTHPKADTKPPPRNEDKFGIDFWHAVEFSRSGRTPTRRLSATRRGNPSSLDPRPRGVKSDDRTELDLVSRPQLPSAPSRPGGWGAASVPRPGGVRRTGLPTAGRQVSPAR